MRAPTPMSGVTTPRERTELQIVRLERIPDHVETFARNADLCFHNWGGQAYYKWAYLRTVAGMNGETFFYAIDGKIIGGTGVNYRLLRAAGGKEFLASIMTGSWVLPEARERGLFTRMIYDSAVRGAARGAEVMIGFAVNDRASTRQLIKAGSFTFPVNHFSPGPETPLPDSTDPVDVHLPDRETARELYDRATAFNGGRGTHTVYSFEEWYTQHLETANRCELWTVGEVGTAVIERAFENDRLLSFAPGPEFDPLQLFGAVLRKSMLDGQRLFIYATREDSREACVKLEMSDHPGCITCLPLIPEQTEEGTPPKHIELVRARMHDPRSEWHSGVWSMNAGDRM